MSDANFTSVLVTRGLEEPYFAPVNVMPVMIDAFLEIVTLLALVTKEKHI